MFSDKELEQIAGNDNYPLQTRLQALQVLETRKLFILLAILPDAIARPAPEEKKPPIVVKKQNRK